MAVYLIYSDATVGWITIIIELVLGMATLAGKVYLDAKFTSDHRLHVAEKGKSIPESRNIFSSHICTHFFIECDMMTQNSEEGMLDQKKALIMALEQVLMEAGLERVTTMNYPTSRDSNSTNVTVLGVEDGYVCVSW